MRSGHTKRRRNLVENNRSLLGERGKHEDQSWRQQSKRSRTIGMQWWPKGESLHYGCVCASEIFKSQTMLVSRYANDNEVYDTLSRRVVFDEWWAGYAGKECEIGAPRENGCERWDGWTENVICRTVISSFLVNITVCLRCPSSKLSAVRTTGRGLKPSENAVFPNQTKLSYI